MALGAVFRDRGRLMRHITARVRSNPHPAVKELHCCRGVACFQLLAYELVRDAVILALDVNVVVDIGAEPASNGRERKPQQAMA